MPFDRVIQGSWVSILDELTNGWILVALVASMGGLLATVTLLFFWLRWLQRRIERLENRI
jgi:hypothetical protein